MERRGTLAQDEVGEGHVTMFCTDFFAHLRLRLRLRLRRSPSVRLSLLLLLLLLLESLSPLVARRLLSESRLSDLLFFSASSVL